MNSLKLNKFINGRKLKPIAFILFIWIFTFSFLKSTLKHTHNRLDRVSGNGNCSYRNDNQYFLIYSHGAPMFVGIYLKQVQRPP